MGTAGFDYAITRTLDAPVEKVWDAWTDSAVYGKWASAEDVSLDVRPGGAWSSVMVIPGGARVSLTGVYTEVVPNERLVMGMDVPGGGDQVLMTMELAADGDRTKITLSQTFDGAEERDQAEQGSAMLLDGLAGYLATA
ncbi:SRPBCC domain-containing protein [Actinomadura geliboluensis]|uniref:SRPBCC family protein n=1 Tax=Actinomadura geliboluensis TaxID=882440 RepID=UPI0036AFFD31